MNDAPAAPGGVLADLRSALDRLTRPPLVVAAGAFLLVLLLGVVGRHLWQLEPPANGNIHAGTGDFLAFWTGAVVLHEHRGPELYHADTQRELQARELGGPTSSFQPYLNPPLLAVLVSFLVPLGYVKAFYIYDAVCAVFLAAGIGCLLLAAPRLRSPIAHALATIVLIAGFQPMIETTLGGQNTAITFALLAALALAMKRRNAIAAGVLLGLLTYKPQYAIGAGVALLLAGQWPVLAGGAGIGIAHYLLGAWWVGLRWPVEMLGFLSQHGPVEIAQNGEAHFSLVRAADFALPSPLAGLVTAAGAAAVLGLWWRYRDLGQRGSTTWFALVVCGTMLLSPHLQYYDVAILALPVCLLLDDDLGHAGSVPLGARLALAVAFIAYPAWRLSETLGFQPLFLCLAAVSLWAFDRCRRAAASA